MHEEQQSLKQSTAELPVSATATTTYAHRLMSCRIELRANQGTVGIRLRSRFDPAGDTGGFSFW
jgi:hypothetical protein